jgi:adenylylsulfate kinase
MKLPQTKQPILWLYGLSGAGKSTMATALQGHFKELGIPVVILDGDELREGLNKSLGFTQEDRRENIRRTAEIASVLSNQGILVITALITPLEEHRQLARDIIGADRFLDVFVDCPLDVCEHRDVKGLYAKARKKEITSFTGIASSFDTPNHPFLHLTTHEHTREECLQILIDATKPLLNRTLSSMSQKLVDV